MEHGGAAAASTMRECAARAERGAKKGKKLRNLRKYMNGTCCEHEAHCTHKVEEKKIAESQTDSLSSACENGHV
jgi:hypothetical protein